MIERIDESLTDFINGGALSRRQLLKLMGLGSVGVALAACNVGSSSSSAKSDTITVDLELETPTLNGLQQNAQYIDWILDQVQEKLYTWNDSLNVVPSLATDFPKVIDDLTQEITIKPGIKFHNGDALTADHVAATLNAAKSNPASTWGGHLALFKNAVAVNDTTIRVSFSSPFGIFIDKVAAIFIMHKDYIDRKDAIMGTGPYMFDTRQVGTSLTLKANNNYRNGPPAVPKIVFRFVGESGARLVNLIRGDSTVLPTPNYSDIVTLQKSPNIRVAEAPCPYDWHILPNSGKPPFNDVRVRQAFAYCIDRAQIRDAVFAGHALIGQGPIGPGFLGYDSSYSPYTAAPQPDKAKQLLQAAGISAGSKIEFDYISVADGYSKDAAVIIQSNAAAVGFKMNLVLVDIGELVNRAIAENFGILAFFTLDGMAYGRDPDAQLFITSDVNPANFFGFHYPEEDAAINQARAASTVDARVAAWQAGNKIIVDKVGQIQPVYPKFVVAYNKALSLPLAQLPLNRLQLYLAKLS